MNVRFGANQSRFVSLNAFISFDIFISLIFYLNIYKVITHEILYQEKESEEKTNGKVKE